MTPEYLNSMWWFAGGPGSKKCEFMTCGTACFQALRLGEGLAMIGKLLGHMGTRSSRKRVHDGGRIRGGDWIDRLARALQGLAEAQEPYLREYWEQNPRVHVVSVGQEDHRPAFPPDDLRDLYAMAYHGHLFGKEEHYAALRAVLDPVRYTLHSHPTLARVVGRIIGKDEFWVQILGSGGLPPQRI